MQRKKKKKEDASPSGTKRGEGTGPTISSSKKERIHPCLRGGRTMKKVKEEKVLCYIKKGERGHYLIRKKKNQKRGPGVSSPRKEGNISTLRWPPQPKTGERERSEGR